MMRISGQAITEAFADQSTQDIGADRIEEAPQGERTTNVTKTMTESVCGSVFVKTHDEFVDNADELQDIDVTTDVIGKAPEVWIEAVTRLRIRCGTSSITLTTEDITFEGTNLQMSGTKIDMASGMIFNNGKGG
jgi:hypothetical protein